MEGVIIAAIISILGIGSIMLLVYWENSKEKKDE
jgi:hypothetical protein